MPGPARRPHVRAGRWKNAEAKARLFGPASDGIELLVLAELLQGIMGVMGIVWFNTVSINAMCHAMGSDLFSNGTHPNVLPLCAIGGKRAYSNLEQQLP